MQFRTRHTTTPRFVEAIQVSEHNVKEIEAFTGGKMLWRNGAFDLFIGGDQFAAFLEDWVIRSNCKWLQPQSTILFASAYEPVEAACTETR